MTPSETTRETEHSDHYAVSTLIIGTQFWIAFPWNDSNLGTLREAYEKLGPGDDAALRNWEDAILDMDSGVVFIQKAGETVVMPPFWPHPSLGVETAVCATFYVAKAVFLPMRMKNIGLWQLANRYWNDTELEQYHLVCCAANLEHFRLVMGKEVHGVDEATCKELCTDWDVVKHSIYSLCAAITDAGKAEKLVMGFKTVWSDFLEKHVQKNRSCRICSTPISYLPGPRAEYYDNSTDDTRLRDRIWEHFSSAHWPPGKG